MYDYVDLIKKISETKWKHDPYIPSYPSTIISPKELDSNLIKILLNGVSFNNFEQENITSKIRIDNSYNIFSNENDNKMIESIIEYMSELLRLYNLDKSFDLMKERDDFVEE